MVRKTLNLREQIINGMALAFFASAYADLADEAGQPLRGEIMDQLPEPIDPAAVKAAQELADKLANANIDSVDHLYLRMLEVDSSGADRELTPDLFGHYCAMQAMGHGVGLDSFGDAVYEAVTVPYHEFSQCSLEGDYFTLGEV